MTLDYNNSRVKTKTGVWDRAEIYTYNNIVNCVNYCVNNIDKDYNNNGENNKIKSDNNSDNNNNRYNNKLEFIGGAKVLNIILIVIKMIVIV